MGQGQGEILEVARSSRKYATPKLINGVQRLYQTNAQRPMTNSLYLRSQTHLT
ncbi:hypothetical protein KBT16_19510 [Nostoc sp. CCCryo 231-06]|nr:hypothetical protein [Nostoc sp. CCCryo 231-06]